MCADKTLKITNSCAPLSTVKIIEKERSVDLLLDAQGRNNITRCNEQETRTRIILLRFMDAACCLANKQLPFQGRDESFTSLNKGNFLEFLNLLKNCGPLL
jgi:hypothetical protein